MSKNYIFLTIIFLLIGNSIIYNSSAKPILIVGANYSNDKVNRGDTVIFTGSIVSNSSSTDTKVISMNVTLARGLTVAAHYSKVYDLSHQDLKVNETVTETIIAVLDLEGGDYNVSIFFDIKDGSHTTPNKIESYYVMTNQTLNVRGLNDNTIGITVMILIVVVLIIVFVFFSTRKN